MQLTHRKERSIGLKHRLDNVFLRERVVEVPINPFVDRGWNRGQVSLERYGVSEIRTGRSSLPGNCNLTVVKPD